ncbi:MAG: class I SAM-dependent methyltransferase [Desulfobacula sp.]|nr:class I SAM-dependent methyltransferase [Desulfobacula sp.]
MSAFTRLGIQKSEALSAEEYSLNQAQTSNTFAYKWANRETYESEAAKSHARDWLFERYCGGNPSLLDIWLSGGRKLILDAGCGSGFTSLIFFGERLRDHDYLGVDISDAVNIAAERFAEAGLPGDFLKSSLMTLPIPESTLDMIYSEGVLHHTDNTEDAIVNLTRLLRNGGRFLFYVYAKKGPVREFTDDHIRHYLKNMNDDDAWSALEPLTKLGKALGDLDMEFEVPEDIPYLGIAKGKVNLQRFFYWNFCKMFYRPEFTLDEMNHINFDWFRPMNCHRHTPDEVRGYCDNAGLEIERMNIQEAGITVVARRKGNE